MSRPDANNLNAMFLRGLGEIFPGWTPGYHLAATIRSFIPFREYFCLPARAARRRWAAAAGVLPRGASLGVGVPLPPTGGWMDRSRP